MEGRRGSDRRRCPGPVRLRRRQRRQRRRRHGGSRRAPPRSTPPIGKVVNPSDKKGGTLKFANSGDWDSLDPGDTYYGFSWNFAASTTAARCHVQGRRRARPRQRARPGPRRGPRQAERRRQDLDLQAPQGRQVRGRHRRHVQGRQVRRRALHRQGDLPERPDVLRRHASTGRGLQGPLQGQGRGHRLGHRDAGRQRRSSSTSSSRSPASTTSRSCRRPLPVPQAKDTGAKYQEARRLDRPVQVRDATRPARSFTLVRNDRAGTRRPTRTARRCRTSIDVTLERQRRRHRQPAACPATSTSTSRAPVCSRPRWPRSCSDPALKAHDRQPDDRASLVHLDQPDGAPFDNIDCRKAVEYAQDRDVLPDRLRRRVAGGDIATTILPPQIPGYEKFDLYPTGRTTRATSTRPRTR